MRAETANRWFPGAGVQELTAQGHEGTVGGGGIDSTVPTAIPFFS